MYSVYIHSIQHLYLVSFASVGYPIHIFEIQMGMSDRVDIERIH